MPPPRISVRLALVALLLSGCAERVPAFRDAPVIIVSIDTLRADRLPAYGATRVATPAIDRLAHDGIVYENAYAHVPLTLPSHATLFSGTLPWENGVRTNVGYRFEPKDGVTLPQLLSRAGYATGGAVSAYVLRAETGMGPLFDWYGDAVEVDESAMLGALQRSGSETLSAAVAWLDRLTTPRFFLFLHLFEPHTPYEPIEPYRSQYADRYDGEIATADAIVGRLIDELERRDLYDSALIVLLSDHGEGLGDHGEAEHGMLLYREAIHVPLIVKLPRREMAGRRVSAPAQMIDVAPTILSALGMTVPGTMRGMSLLELIEQPRDRAIYSESLYSRIHLGWSELRSLVDSRFHYIGGPKPELYDMASDPAERNNMRDRNRRESARFARELAAVPLNLTAAAPADPEERARLAALGYLSGGAAETNGPRLNPRDHIHVVEKVQRCATLRSERRYREGADLCRQIIRDYPDLVDAYSHLAANLRHMGRSSEALDMYQEALRRAPQLVDSLALEVAKLELDLGNLHAAELNARQAMKLNPLEAHLLLAAVALERRDLERAAHEAGLAVGGADRPRVPALIMLSRILTRQGKLHEALATIDRATERVERGGAPAEPTLAATRADILARLGRNAEAEAAFRDEIRRFPRTREAYTRLAILLASQHRFSEINPLLQSMVQASPSPATYRLAAQVMDDLGNEQMAGRYRREATKSAGSLSRQTAAGGS